MKPKKTVPTFQEFWRDVEAGARARGPAAVEHLEDLRAAFGLARELVRARQQHGLAQQAVAKRAGIAQADLSRYERAKGNPEFLTLSKLGKVYGGISIRFGPSGSPGKKNTKMQGRTKMLARKAARSHRRTA
jgi:ribosome-binding protein aMBF1 (putative translation factor)